jgi:uncharacterized membrane protein YbhN (UPF0104 family)
LNKIDFESFRGTISAIPAWTIGASLLCLWLSIAIRCVQWRCLLPTSAAIRRGGVFKSLCAGYVGNAFIPWGGGDFLKAYFLCRFSNVTIPQGLASIYLMRLCDLPPVLLLILAGLTLFTKEGGQARFLAIPASIFALVTAVLFLLTFYVSRGNRTPLPLIARIAPLFEQLRDTRGIRRYLMTQTHAFTCWAIFVVAPIPLMLALSFEPANALKTSVAMTGFAALVQMVPITPGAIGTYHLLCFYVAGALNPSLGNGTIAAYAVASHLIGTLGPALPGLLSLPWILGEIRRAPRMERHKPFFAETALGGEPLPQ